MVGSCFDDKLKGVSLEIERDVVQIEYIYRNNRNDGKGMSEGMIYFLFMKKNCQDLMIDNGKSRGIIRGLSRFRIKVLVKYKF